MPDMSIPLQTQGINLLRPDQLESARAEMIRNKALELQLQERQQQITQQGQVKQLLSDPTNIDPATGQPNEKGVKAIAQISPQLGQEAYTSFLQTKATRSRIGLEDEQATDRRDSRLKERTEMLHETGMGAQLVYDKAKREGKSEQEAIALADEVYGPSRKDVATSGHFNDDELKNLPEHFDPKANYGLLMRTTYMKNLLSSEQKDAASFKPESAIGKLDADLKAGRITQKEHDAALAKETHVAEGSEGKPLSDVGKINADLKAGRITQAQADSMLNTKTTAREEAEEDRHTAKLRNDWIAKVNEHITNPKSPNPGTLDDYVAANKGGGATAAPKGEAPIGKPLDLPKTKDALETGKVYQTRRGPAKWNGSSFDPVK